MLVAGSVVIGEGTRPNRGIYLGYRRPTTWDVPAIKGPEMHAGAKALADEAQPGNAGMGGFRHRSLHIEMKHRLRAACSFLGQAPPPRMAHARGAVADDAVAHELD